MKKQLIKLIVFVLISINSNAQAILPTFWNFSSPSINTPPNGWITGLGTNGALTYTLSVGGDNVSARLDATGEFITISFIGRPGQLSYWLKGTGVTTAFTGQFLVQESVDSINWYVLRGFSSMNTAFTRYIDYPSINSRFVRFYYDTKGVGSNVALDSVVLLPKSMVCNNPILTIGMPDTLIGYKTSRVSLSSNSYNHSFSYFWDNGDTSYNYLFSKLPNKKYYLTFFDTLGHCGIDSLHVAFVNGINEKDTSLCNGVSKSISISNQGLGYKYLWNTNDTTSSILVSPISNTTYRCIERYGSFVLIDSLKITVNGLPFINTLTDTTLAIKKDSFLLNAGSGYANYLWSTGDTLQSIWVKSSSKYKIKVSNIFGCNSFDSTNLLFMGIRQKDTAICAGNPLRYSVAINPSQANWSTSDSTLKIIVFGSSYEIGVNPSKSCMIRCVNRVGSYVIYDSVFVLIRLLPSIEIFYPKRGLCVNDTINLEIPTAGITCDWKKASIWGSIGIGNNKIQSVYAMGQYFVDIYDSTGCWHQPNNNGVIIYNAPLPHSRISTLDTSLCLIGNIFKFADSTQIDSGFVNSYWSFDNGQTSNLKNTTQSYTTVGSHSVKLLSVSNNGCKDSTTKNVIVKSNPTAGVLLGPTNTLLISTPYVYTVAQQVNHTYNWIVQNGIVAAGQGTNVATVQWISNGKGFIKVELFNSEGCIDTAAIQVNIGNTGVEELGLHSNIYIFPNPTEGKFSVGLNLYEDIDAKFEIRNALGQKVWMNNYRLQSGKQEIPVNLDLKAGLYFLAIYDQNNNLLSTKKLMISQ